MDRQITDQEDIAAALRGLAADIENGDKHVTGAGFDIPNLDGSDGRFWLNFDDVSILEWNQEFWERARSG